MRLSRRHFLVCLPPLGMLATPLAASEVDADLQLLRPFAFVGASYATSFDAGHSGGKVWRVAGEMPGGGREIVAVSGSRVLEFTLPRPGDGTKREQLIVAQFRHVEAAVAQAKGRRLNHLAAEPSSWMDINARLFVYEIPGAEGPLQFGFWTQEGGSRQWLIRFAPPQVTKPAQADDLSARLQAFGRVPLYLQFDTNSAELRADGQLAVQQVLAVLKAEPALRLSIEGHTDNVGSDATNRPLSLARAQAVRDALLAQGVAPKRLAVQGYGSTRSVADGATEVGRAKNRRVELVRLP
jgi:outer membrane protein OmpA-like peptidoglycan-associated protein